MDEGAIGTKRKKKKTISYISGKKLVAPVSDHLIFENSEVLT